MSGADGDKMQIAFHQGQGFSLIEILVALLILSIGILGVASTQVVSMQMNGQSTMRSQAVLLANDYLDRMRANPDNLADYALAEGAAEGAAADDSCDLGFNPYAAPAGTALATIDVNEWDNSLACLLPEAQREVEVNGANPATVIVRIDWRKPTEGNNVVIDSDSVVVETRI